MAERNHTVPADTAAEGAAGVAFRIFRIYHHSAGDPDTSSKNHYVCNHCDHDRHRNGHENGHGGNDSRGRHNEDHDHHLDDDSRGHGPGYVHDSVHFDFPV